ncbi:MAG: sigma-70 family RNA polymerase sigma factor [Candidatus Nanopelagicaceae bacterium]
MSSDCDTVKFWLDSAGRYPVLDTEQVLMLARQIQSNPPESMVYQRALKKLVRHNLKLIPNIAKRAMRNKHGKNYGGTYTEDVFQCGVIGLVRAAQKFDPTRGYAFSTYAIPWIFQAMQRDLYNNTSSIRVPENTIREYYSVFRNSNKHGEFTANQVHRYHDCILAIGVKSLDSFSSSTSDDEANLHDCISIGSGEENVAKDTIRDLLSKSKCSELTKIMMLEYYEENLTYNQIASRHNVTRERATKMINNCLKDLRRRLSAV